MNDKRQVRWICSVRGVSGKPGGRAALLGMMALALFMTGAGPCSGPTPPTPVSATTPASQGKEQAESAVVFATAFGPPTTVVAYNDQTNANGALTTDPDGTNARWHPGYTEMGFAYSPDRTTWTRDFAAAQYDDGSHNWVAFFGDPALASGGPLGNFVFYSNLAATDATFGPGYVTIFDRTMGVKVGPKTISVLNGACVARSTDAGATFAPWGCIYAPDFTQNPSPLSKLSGFDGGSLAADVTGNVYAAYASVLDAAQPAAEFVKVFHADGHQPTGAFEDISPPNNGVTTALHPLIRAKNGRVYLMQAQAGSNQAPTGLVLRVGDGTVGGWTAQKVLTTAHQTPLNNQVDFGDGTTMKQDPWFSFDVSATELKYAYTVFAGGFTHIHLGRCTLKRDGGVDTCVAMPGWATETEFPGGAFLHQLQPQVVVGKRANGTEVWKFVYLSQAVPGAALVDLIDTELANTAPGFLSNYRVATTTRRVCSETNGYWGDYDGTAASPDFGFYTAFPTNGVGGVVCTDRTSHSTTPPTHVDGIDL